MNRTEHDLFHLEHRYEQLLTKLTNDLDDPFEFILYILEGTKLHDEDGLGKPIVHDLSDKAAVLDFLHDSLMYYIDNTRRIAAGSATHELFEKLKARNKNN